MTELLGSAARPLRVAIIGSGPAGFYTAEALFKQKELNTTIDLFNRFPTPFGLVRDGVAPDHQEIKAVIRIYDRLLADPRLRFFGNVTFGVDITHDELAQYYDQIVYAVGAQADRRMGIPGEELQGSYAATAFVGWYNGHPDYRDMNFDLSCENVIVVGNGNVAMDVTRILVKDPEELAKTDIAEHALMALRNSKVRRVIMLGRRGPVQASFTTPELKEFGELHGVSVHIAPADLELDEQSQAALSSDKVATRNMDLLRQYAARADQDTPRQIEMRFLESPVELLGEAGHVTAVRIERNKLVLDENGGLRARGIAEFETIPAGLVLRSVGYRGVPLAGVPFNDSLFTIANVAGRVTHSASGEPVKGEYVVGWAKRGPSGIIGTNKADAVSTVAGMLEDLPNLHGIDDSMRDPALIEKLLQERHIPVVTYAGWQAIDAYEQRMGAEQGRPRVKLTRVDEMLKVIAHS